MVCCILLGGYIGFYYFKLEMEKRISFVFEGEVITNGNPPSKTFPLLSPEELLRLGWAHERDGVCPQTSYLNTPFKKAPGIIRVGLFGDSFTEGSETTNGNDVGSLLQKLLNEKGYTHVEVVNFAVSGYGVHQSFMLWEILGKKYDLDYGIGEFYDMHFQRDNTFKLYFLYYALHSRYILKDDGIERIDLIGNTDAEVRNKYHSFFQPAQYFRHDRRVPNFLGNIPWIKENPFYYSSLSDDDEVLEIYRRIFEKWTTELPRIAIRTVGPKLGQMESPSLINMNETLPALGAESLYRAPNGHRSSYGNFWVANDMLTMLTGEKSLNHYWVWQPSNTYGGVDKRTDLSKEKYIAFQLGECYTGGLFSHKENKYFSKRIDAVSSGANFLVFLPNENGKLSFLPIYSKVENEKAYILSLGDTVACLGALEPINGFTFVIRKNDTIFDGNYNPVVKSGGEYELAIGGMRWPLEYSGDGTESFRLNKQDTWIYRLDADTPSDCMESGNPERLPLGMVTGNTRQYSILGYFCKKTESRPHNKGGYAAFELPIAKKDSL